MKIKNMQNTRKGFSLVELLTTFSIIIILATLLSSSIYTAREKAKMATCINNLKNLTAAVILSANDSEDFPIELTYEYMPSSGPSEPGTAYAGVSDYYDNQLGITQCPKVVGKITDSTPMYSYGINQLVRGVKLHKVKYPSEIMVSLESSDKSVVSTVTEVSFRHMGFAFAGFADGHVEHVKFAQMIDALDDYLESPVDNPLGDGVLHVPGPYLDDPPPEETEFTFTDDSVCTPSFRWDFQGITDNGDGTKTFTFTFTNNKNRGLSHVSFELPAGVVAESPSDGGNYVGTHNNYGIENPTNLPFYCIKFETIGEGIKNGESETFAFTLADEDVDLITQMRVEAKASSTVNQGVFTVGPEGTGNGGCPN